MCALCKFTEANVLCAYSILWFSSHPDAVGRSAWLVFLIRLSFSVNTCFPPLLFGWMLIFHLLICWRSERNVPVRSWHQFGLAPDQGLSTHPRQGFFIHQSISGYSLDQISLERDWRAAHRKISGLLPCCVNSSIPWCPSHLDCFDWLLALGKKGC